MTEQKIRAEMDKVIDKVQATGEDTASLEILREWFMSAEFRARLAQYTWEINRGEW